MSLQCQGWPAEAGIGHCAVMCPLLPDNTDKVTQSYSSLTILLGLEFRGREQTLHCIVIMHISKLFSSLETSDKKIAVIPHPPEEDCHGRKMFWSLLY